MALYKYVKDKLPNKKSLADEEAQKFLGFYTDDEEWNRYLFQFQTLISNIGPNLDQTLNALKILTDKYTSLEEQDQQIEIGKFTKEFAMMKDESVKFEKTIGELGSLNDKMNLFCGGYEFKKDDP